jgi:aspartyl-tRNA(Asn)/glutamyl-tRNA(Gln) amidotransferase subunit C
MTELDRDTVRRLAELARLELDEEETSALVHDLTRILHHVDTLSELDLEGVPPMTSAFAGRAALRSDEPRVSLPRELALREAPKVVDDGFAVPAFVDEG